MKAFRVSNAYEENAVIVFHTSNAAARRLGATALNEGFEDVTCKRDPEFDQYAPGPVPWQMLIEKHGWWHSCWNCDNRVCLGETIETDDGEEIEIQPVYDTQDRVFCCQQCFEQFQEEMKCKALQRKDVSNV